MYNTLIINAVKGLWRGSGVAGSQKGGSNHNDAFYTDQDGRTLISNGEEIYFRVAFKPTSTIMEDQESIDDAGESVVLKGKGRHDPCVVPRAVLIVEAMAALVMADLWLRGRVSRV